MDNEELQRLLAQLAASVKRIEDNQVQSTERLTKLEEKTSRFTTVPPANEEDSQPYQAQIPDPRGDAIGAAAETPTPPALTDLLHGGFGPVTNFLNPAEVQREYETLADSFKTVKLARELKLRDAKQGLKGADDRAAATTIAKSGRYVETALRWLYVQQPGQISSGDLKQLFTILVAQLNFLQGEHSALVVKGQFDKDTSDLWKCLEGNSSSFTPSALQNLRAAAEITAARQHSSHSQSVNRGHRGGRGGFRSGRGYRGRGDVFSHFSSRGFPQHRPQGQASEPNSTGYSE